MAAAKKKLDSLDPTLTCDPQSFPTEKIGDAESAVVELVSADPRLEARIIAGSTLTMLAYVADEGHFDAFLALKVDGNFMTCGLHKGMAGEDIVEEIRRTLPPGYQCATRESSQSEVLIVTLLRPEIVSDDPEVSFLATDPGQMFRWQGKNKLRIEGRAVRGLSLRSHVELFIEGYKVRLPIAGGDFPLGTAMRLRDALPKRYTALVELPMVPGGDVTLTILRRR